jgi:FixJ family two-component response regulator
MIHNAVVYIVDDDEAALEAVSALVGEMGVKAKTYASAEAFLDDYDGYRPGCLVTDVRMLGMSGVELQEKLARDGITLSVIVLTAYADTRTTIRAIKGGAITLLEKPCRDQELWDAIRTALLNDWETTKRETRLDELHRRFASLSPGEQKVMQRIVKGESNKVMAKRLRVSVRTIEVRRHHVFKKLEADSVAELVRMYLEAFPDSELAKSAD